VAVIKENANQRALTSLTLAALALPGVIASAHAELAPQEYSLDANVSHYEESGRRMAVDIYQGVATASVNDKLSFKLNAVNDVVTGASPVGPAVAGLSPLRCKGPSSGGLTQCMSGATIHEQRTELDLNASYKLDAATLDVDAGRSSENDYISNFFNLNSRWELNNKMTTLTTGYGYASDKVWENGVKSGPVAGGNKETHQGILGLTQILDKDSLLQANLTYSYSGGYLSDPYKYAYAPWHDPYNPFCFLGCSSSTAYAGFIRDTRPGSRNQVGMLLRYVRNFSELNAAALHVDYRYYADTWGIDSHTFEVSWIQPVLAGWQITPRVRYYTQNSADFYNVMFTAPTANGYYSSDYRLAGFGAIGGGVQISKAIFDWLKVTAGVDYYQRDKGYGLSGGNGTALDNFSFSMYSASLNVKF